jgi:hypothetical protein
MKKYILVAGFFVFAQQSFAGFSMPQYCSVVAQCLGKIANGCAGTDINANENINYNQEFCAPVKELNARGIDYNDATGRRAYFQLGNEYRVTFVAEGKLPMSAEMMRYNVNNIPFAGFLINAYQDTKYKARYTSLDKLGFWATNGNNLTGDFVWMSRQNNDLNNIVFATGKVKVLTWGLWRCSRYFRSQTHQSKRDEL